MRYKLGEIFNLQMGKTPDRHSPKFWNEGTEPWISIADLTKCNKYIENTAEKITATAVDESSRLWVCQGIKLQFACIRGISEKGAKNQTLCGPDENDAARLTGRLQNGLVRLSIPEDSEDHSGHLSADMTNHIHVMQTFGYFLFVIGLKHRITMHCYRGRQPNGTT